MSDLDALAAANTKTARGNLSRCRACNGVVSKSAIACPHCGEPHPVGKRNTRSAIRIAFLVMALAGVVGIAVADTREGVAVALSLTVVAAMLFAATYIRSVF